MELWALEFLSGVNRQSVGDLVSYLNRLPEGDCDLLLLIGSAGGDNQWARSAHSALVNLPNRIRLTTCGCGTVDSSAVTIYCAGEKRLCLPQTRFQLHQATWKINELVDLRRAQEIAGILQSDDQAHATVISTAIGQPEKDVLSLIKQGTVWMASEALNQGLVHEITGAVPRLLEGRKVERIFNVEL